MAILSYDDAINRVRKFIGDTPDGDAVEFLADMVDTLNDMNNGDTDFRKKYEENDAAWRKIYAERFLHGDAAAIKPPHDDANDTTPDEPNPDEIIANLFK